MCRYRGRVGTSLAHLSRPFSSPDCLTPHAIFRLVESETLPLQHLPYYHEYRHFRTAIPMFLFRAGLFYATSSQPGTTLSSYYTVVHPPCHSIPDTHDTITSANAQPDNLIQGRCRFDWLWQDVPGGSVGTLSLFCPPAGPRCPFSWPI